MSNKTSSKVYTVSKSVPMSSRPDSDVLCICGCSRFAKLGSDVYDQGCNKRVWSQKRRKGVTQQSLLPEYHVAIDTVSFDIRWKRAYIKYGTNPDRRMMYVDELSKKGIL